MKLPPAAPHRRAWRGLRPRPGRMDALVLFGAGVALLVGVVVVLRYVLDALLTVAGPSERGVFIASPVAVRNALVVAVGIALVMLVVGRRAGGSARLRLALSYAAFLVVAGVAVLVGVYIVLRYVPSYPLTAANPSQAGEATASREAILSALVGASGIILAVLAVVGAGGGWILAGWVLRPLERINDAARIAATGNLEHRIQLAGRKDEFRQLADAFDVMLDRLHDAFTAQERFAANASHELRTPLTVTATLLDVARRHPSEQHYPTLIEQLSSTNARAIGLTEALLRLADVNAVTAASAPHDLAVIVRDVVATSSEVADAFDVTMETHLEPAMTVGDAALLTQLASNLIQNAIRHNHESGTMCITTNRDRARAVTMLRVENTGAPYTAARAAQLSEPFLRGKGRVRDRDGAQRGYGLGLALVARIVDVHHGVLAIDPRDGGGLVVTVTLPDHARGRVPLAEPADHPEGEGPPSDHLSPCRRDLAERGDHIVDERVVAQQ